MPFSLGFSRGKRTFDLPEKLTWSAQQGKTLDLGDVKATTR
jgi:hypothetical protein